MIKYHDALSLVTNFAIEKARLRRTIAEVPLGNLPGRVLAEPVIAPEDFPGFDASLMDGFAVRSPSTESASQENLLDLSVAARLFAGDKPLVQTPEGDVAVAIATGAPLPADFDAVVRLEDVTQGLEGGEIRLRRPVIRGDHVRYRASDVRKGLVILDRGTRIDAQHLPLLAALGIQNCKVWRKPRVSLVATGDEIASDPGMPVEFGKVRNCTAPILTHMLQSMGCEVNWYGSIGDDAAELTRILEDGTYGNADMIISTGGVSMGERDYATEALQRIKSEVLFHRVAMKPGKPTLFARLGPDEIAAPVYFGLPGNPMSTVVGARFLVGPFLRALLGLPGERSLRLRAGNPCVKAEGTYSFLLARVTQTENGLEVYVHSDQDSFRVLPLSRSNAWVVVPEIRKGFSADELVEVLPLFSEGYPREWLQ